MQQLVQGLSAHLPVQNTNNHFQQQEMAHGFASNRQPPVQPESRGTLTVMEIFFDDDQIKAMEKSRQEGLDLSAPVGNFKTLEDERYPLPHDQYGKDLYKLQTLLTQIEKEFQDRTSCLVTRTHSVPPDLFPQKVAINIFEKKNKTSWWC